MKKNKTLFIIILVITFFTSHTALFGGFKYSGYISEFGLILIGLIIFLSKD